MIGRLASRAQHLEYLRSPEWRDLRAQALERDGRRCMLCYSGYRLNVHHRRYPRPWQRDHLGNLCTLCRWCHKGFHQRQQFDRVLNRVLLAAITLGGLWIFLYWRDALC